MARVDRLKSRRWQRMYGILRVVPNHYYLYKNTGHCLTAEHNIVVRENRFMRACDLARLSAPYPEDEDSTDGTAMSALGLPLRRWNELEALILDDFVDQPPYGIGWWAPHPGTSRRIPISDQLYACIASVSANMTEAVLERERANG